MNLQLGDNFLTVFNSWEDMSVPERRKTMEQFGKMCKQLESEVGAVQVPLREWFVEGIYAREVVMPKGTIVVGEIHKTQHLSVVSKGKVLLASEDGTEVLEAPYTYINKIGAKRLLYILEDTVWTTFHRTDHTDLTSIRKELIADSFEELELFLENKQDVMGLLSSGSGDSSGRVTISKQREQEGHEEG